MVVVNRGSSCPERARHSAERRGGEREREIGLVEREKGDTDAMKPASRYYAKRKRPRRENLWVAAVAMVVVSLVGFSLVSLSWTLALQRGYPFVGMGALWREDSGLVVGTCTITATVATFLVHTALTAAITAC